METGHAEIYMPSSGILSAHHSVTVFPTKTYPLTLHRSTSSSNHSGYLSYGNPQLAAMSRCRCIIDLSTPATLERDFYAWLNVSVVN
uniref:Uncharacterized protein n=1 Tax=Ditylenchus dipsaci TaxID=166011 RepID=A0A915DUD9_9BILA